MSDVIPSNLKKRRLYLKPFSWGPQTRHTHTHTHTHYDSIRRNAMRCISHKNGNKVIIQMTNKIKLGLRTQTSDNKSTKWFNYCRKTGDTPDHWWKLKKHDSKYKDNKFVSAGFVYTSLSRNKHQQRNMRSLLTRKRTCTQIKVMQQRLLIHAFSLTGIRGGSQTKMSVKEK